MNMQKMSEEIEIISKSHADEIEKLNIELKDENV